MKQAKIPARAWVAATLIGLLVLAAWGWQWARIAGYEPPPVDDWSHEAPARNWNWIVIHHSASETGDAASFDVYHRSRGWSELGYHFVINNGERQPDGLVEVGGRWRNQRPGAHSRSPGGEFNDRGIGICLVGNFQMHPPTPAQWEAVVRLCAHLCRTYQISPTNIIPHHAATPTTQCPGQHFDIDRLRQDVTERLRTQPRRPRRAE